MSKIDELMKNETVEWKRLGDVCEIIRGVRVTKQDLIIDGKYPVVSGGTGYMGYINQYNREENTITIAQYGTAGYVNWQIEKFWANDVCFSVYPTGQILKRFLYHFLLNKQEYLYSISNKSAIPYSISKDKIMKIEIPIPSLKTQEKIVKILDSFTNYVAELQTELQTRTKQYSYYRDMLLSERYLNKISKKIDNVENKGYKLRFTTLGEIGTFTRGNGLQKSDFIPEGKPVIHYGQIYTQFGFATEKTVSFVSDEIFSKLKKAQPKNILIATTSENIEDVGKSVVWLGDKEIGFSGDMYSYTTNENSKYIAYYFQTVEFQKQKEKKVTGTKLIRIHGDDMEKFIIPLPPIEIQNKVVQILDKFQALIEDTKGLLPQEIEQRKKQYEYYRETLLTFNTNPHNASDERRATSDERRATSDERRATSDERRATSDERRATSDERRATSDERRATSDERRATSV